MKKYNIKLICGIISIILMIQLSVLTGCDKQAGNNPNETNVKISDDMFETVTNVYRTKNIDLPGDFWYDKTFISGERIYILSASEATGYVLISFDYNGENMETKPIPRAAGVSERYGINAVGFLSDGSYIIVSDNFIYRLESDGKVLFSEEITASDLYAELYITEDDKIYLSNEREITVFDSELNILFTAGSEAALSGFARDSGGNIVIHDYNNPQLPYYHLLNSDRQALEAYEKIMMPANVNEYSGMYFGDGYDAYFSDIRGVYGYNTGNTEATLLLDWENSDIPYVDTEITAILSENKFFANIWDDFTSKKIFVLLERIPDNEVAPKIPVVFALTGITGTEMLHEAAALFNRTNDTYRITFRDYTVYNAAPDFNQAVEKFNNDILQGIIPDIVYLNDRMMRSVDIYTSKKFFTDLSIYFGGDHSDGNILGCVRSSYESNGSVYHIPLQMKLETLAAKRDIAGKSQTLTLEQLYGLADSLPEGSSLFSSPAGRNILYTAMFDFVDFENKTCSFESERFIRLLDFITNISDYTDESKGALIRYFRTDQYIFTSGSLTDSIAGGSLVFLQLPLYNTEAFALAKYCFGGGDFTFCGFPTASGNGSQIFCTYSLGIPEQSRKKEGAWEFIGFLLSDKIQTSEKLTKADLPVTRSAIEKLLEYSHYYLLVNQYADEYIEADEFLVFKFIDEPPANHPWVEMAKYHITLTAGDKSDILSFFDGTEIKSRQNEKVKEIIEEELGAFYAGDVTAAEAAKFIQNRVYTYINE